MPRQLEQQLLQVRRASRHHAALHVGPAGGDERFDDVRQAVEQLGDGFELALLHVELHPGLHLQTHRRQVELRLVADDDAALPQPVESRFERRSGDADVLGHLPEGRARHIAQGAEHAPIEIIDDLLGNSTHLALFLFDQREAPSREQFTHRCELAPNIGLIPTLCLQKIDRKAKLVCNPKPKMYSASHSGDTLNLGITLMIIAYLLVMFLIAAWLKKRVHTDTDYLLAGRKMGAGLIAVMLLATNFGGAFVLGTSQDAYSVGFAAISFAIGIFVGLVFLAVFVAKRVRAGSFVTVPDFLHARFGSQPVRLLASTLSVLALTGILAGQVGAAGSALTALGLSQVWGAIVGVVLIIAFTVLSGMWGVAITDAIQFVVIVAGMILVAVIAVNAAGGFATITSTFEASGVAEPFNPLNQGWSFMLGAALPVVVHKLVGQDVMQRVFSAKSARAAATGAGIAGLLTAGFAVVPALAGMAARALFPELDPSVGVMPALIENVLPVWAAGVLLAAIISAVISTADALLLAAVSNISNDFLQRFRHFRDSQQSQLRWSRIVTVALGVIALGVSLLVPGIIQVLTMAFTMYGSGVFVAFMFGLFTRFGGRYAALASMVTGAVTGLLGLTGVLVIGAVPTIVTAVGVSLITYVIVAALARETPSRLPAQQDRAVAHA